MKAQQQAAGTSEQEPHWKLIDMRNTALSSTTPRVPVQRTPMALRLTITAIMCLACIDNANQNAFFAVQTWIVGDFHLNYTHVAWLGSATALGALVATVPLAFLADRVPRIKLVGYGAIAWACLTGLAGLAAGFLSLFLLRLLDGLGAASYDVQSAGVFADFYPPERRSWMLSWQQGLEGVGLVIGGGVAVLIAQTAGWRATFLIFGLAALPFAIWMQRRPEPPRARFDGGVRPLQPVGQALRQSFQTISASRAMQIGTLGRGIQTFSVAAIGTFLPLYLIHNYGLSRAAAEQSFNLVGLALTVATVLGGMLASRLYRRYGAGSNFLVTGVGSLACGLLFLAGLLSPLWLLLLFACLAGAGIGATYAPMYAMVSEVIPAESRYFALGIQSFFALLLGVISTLLFGFFADAFNLQLGMVGLSIMLALVGLLMSCTMRTQRREAERLQQQRLYGVRGEEAI